MKCLLSHPGNAVDILLFNGNVNNNNFIKIRIIMDLYSAFRLQSIRLSWNSLPPELRRPDTELGEFRRLLKSFLFA